MNSMVNTQVAPAWLLEYQSGRFAAFALHATLALFDIPDCAFVPGAPGHCLGLVRWEGRRLPLIDLARVDDDPALEAARVGATQALVLAWQPPAPSAHAELGAVAVPHRVTMIEVRDEQQCDAPGDARALRSLAASWFMHEGHAVAIVDPARLFCGRTVGTPRETSLA